MTSLLFCLALVGAIVLFWGAVVVVSAWGGWRVTAPTDED